MYFLILFSIWINASKFIFDLIFYYLGTADHFYSGFNARHRINYNVLGKDGT